MVSPPNQPVHHRYAPSRAASARAVCAARSGTSGGFSIHSANSAAQSRMNLVCHAESTTVARMDLDCTAGAVTGGAGVRTRPTTSLALPISRLGHPHAERTPRLRAVMLGTIPGMPSA